WDSFSKKSRQSDGGLVAPMLANHSVVGKPAWDSDAGPASEQRVDQRRDRRALRQDQQASEHDQDHEDRKQPELLALAHERPEVAYEIEHQKGLSRERGGRGAFGLR